LCSIKCVPAFPVRLTGPTRGPLFELVRFSQIVEGRPKFRTRTFISQCRPPPWPPSSENFSACEDISSVTFMKFEFETLGLGQKSMDFTCQWYF
jgi:hypothetical protein